MSLDRIWQQLRIDCRALAIVRIGYGALILVDLARRAPELAFANGPGGFYPAEIARGVVTVVISLHSLSDALWLQWALFGVAAVAGAALLVGFRSRTAALVSWYLLLSLHLRNTNMADVGDHALGMCLLWLVFLPCGARWGLDAGRARRRGEIPPTEVASIASAGLLLQVAAILFFSAFWKLSGTSWLDGTAVRLAISDDVWARPFGVWLLGYPALTALLTWATLTIEFFGPLVLVFSPRRLELWTRPPVLLGLLGFFVGVGSGMNLGLIPWIMGATLMIFLPTALLDRVFGPDPEPVPARADPGGIGLLGKVVPTAALALMLFLNVDGLRSAPLLGGTSSRFLASIRLNQGWGMYSPDPRVGSFRFIFVAEQADGRVRSLALGGVRPGWPPMPTDPPLERIWNDYRMKMALQDRITLPPQRRALKALGLWYCRHSPLAPVRVQIRKVARRTVLAEPDRPVRSLLGTGTPLPYLDCPARAAKHRDDA